MGIGFSDGTSAENWPSFYAKGSLKTDPNPEEGTTQGITSPLIKVKDKGNDNQLPGGDDPEVITPDVLSRQQSLQEYGIMTDQGEHILQSDGGLEFSLRPDPEVIEDIRTHDDETLGKDLSGADDRNDEDESIRIRDEMIRRSTGGAYLEDLQPGDDNFKQY